MKDVLKTIVWIVYGIIAIYFIHNQAKESGIIAFVFGIPATVIGGVAIYALFQKNDKN